MQALGKLLTRYKPEKDLLKKFLKILTDKIQILERHSNENKKNIQTQTEKFRAKPT